MKHDVGNRNAPVEAATEVEKRLTPEQKLRQKVDGEGGPPPAMELQQFRGAYEKTVDAPILPGFPGASTGENIARLIAGEEISGLKVDRLEVLKELAEDVAREAVIHLAMEGVGDLLEMDELAAESPRPNVRDPALEFVSETPAVGENWRYADRMDVRPEGHNVQADHILSQTKMKDALREQYNPQCLTVLAETGRANAERPALPHTEATFHGPLSDVAQIKRIREQGGIKNWSADIVDKSVQSRLNAGYPEASVTRAVIDELGVAHQSQSPATLASRITELSPYGDGTVTSDIEKLNWSALSDPADAPQALKGWGEREAGEAAMKNDLNQQAVQQQQNTAARNTEASNSVQEQLKQSRAAMERASSDASQTVSSASSEIKRNNENLEGWLQNQPDLELSNAADAVQQVAQEALNKAQEVAQSIFQMVEAALQPNNTSDIRQDSQKIVDAALNTSRDLQRFAADVHETNQRATETAADALFAGKQQEARQALQDAEQQMTQMRDRAMDDMRRTTESIQAAQIEQARSEAARVEQRRQEQEREAQR